jgi:ubiquinone/menaquinone biosynthesis C-methylase UbiE
MRIDSNNIEENILINMVKPEKKEILEIGCGGGRQASYLSKNSKKYFAIDLNEKLINENISKFINSNIIFEQGDASCLKFEDSSFDIVFMMLCFHEINNALREKAINEIHRVLRSNGKAIIIDPKYPSCKFQSLFDFNYKTFINFDHPAQVKESNNLIKRYIDNGKFNLENITNYEVDYTFENYDELFSVMMEDAQGLNFSSNVEERDKIIKEFLNSILSSKDIKESGEIKLFDNLTALILTKIDN